MLEHMRTTIDIGDSLMAEVRRTMKKRGITLRALVEEALRRAMAEGERKPIELPDARFPGRAGLVSGIDASDLPRLITESRHQGRADQE